MWNNRKILFFKAPAICAVVTVFVMWTQNAVAQTDAAAPISMGSLLKEMVDFEAMARWPDVKYTTAMISSTSLASEKPEDAEGWFHNIDNSIFRKQEAKGDRTEWVMLDVKGPGCITRFWYGGFGRAGNLRVYIDGNSEPVLDAPFYKLLSGAGEIPYPLAFEVTKPPQLPEKKGKAAERLGGLNLFLPIPYKKECKMVYSLPAGEKSEVPIKMFFYNIEYRTYPAGTKVESFKSGDLQAKAGVIKRTAETLLNPKAAGTGERLTLERTLNPGEDAALDLPKGPAAVRELKIRIDESDKGKLEQALRSTILKANFDGKETIWCPVGDFSGSGVGLNELKSWYRTVTSDGWMTSRWVMPYSKSGRLSLQNVGKEPVKVSMEVACGDWKWDLRSMLFHSTWRSERNIPTRPYSDWNYITIEGKGVYMGDSLSHFNRSTTWWGEGDEKITVDKGAFPSYFGTGTEDYYCYAFGGSILKGYQTPFANQPRMDAERFPDAKKKNNLGYVVVSRTRNLDRIVFQNHLKLDMEIWHWKDTTVDHALAAYWYGMPDARHNRVSQAEEAAMPLPLIPTKPEEKPDPKKPKAKKKKQNKGLTQP